MAELHIIGQILNATDFEEPNLFIKWSIQIGTAWKFIEGITEGQTATDRNRFENCSVFAHPLDIHLSSRGLQGWPKLHVEINTINALNQCWPVGFGFVHIPTQPGYHKLKIPTWRIAPGNFLDILRDKFHAGGYTVCKSDLIYSGIERYKLGTKSSGFVNVELMLIFKNFTKFGIELK